jgi:superfamily II DNA or RNA helicase
MIWEKGLEVRLCYNPGRTGTCTGKVRQIGPVTRVQVRFSDGTMEYLPEDDLEALKETNTDDPYELIAKGKYGRASDLRRNLTYVHLSGRLANLLYSMGVTETDFYPHQYKPLLTLLDSPANGILIADEVGLGKTIEAGLIWTELRARYDFRRLLIVCPAMLREKWRDELQRRFGIAAEILDADGLRETLAKPRHSSLGGQACIVSYQTARPPREWRPGKQSAAKRPSARWRLAELLRDSAGSEPLVDLVIFDEAHYMRNPDSAVYTLGTLLRDVSDYLVLLSATPINLHNEELFNLLRLVDPEHFQFRSEFQHMLQANQPLVRARDAALNPKSTAAEISEFLSYASKFPILQKSLQLKALLDQPPSDYDLADRGYRVTLANTLERLNLLGNSLSRTRKREVQSKRIQRKVKRECVLMSDDEKTLYQAVTRLTREFAWKRGISDGFLLVTPQRLVSSCPAAAAKAWIGKDKAWISDIKDQYDVDEADLSNTLSLTEFLRAHLPNSISIESLRANDSKYQRLRSVMVNFFHNHPNEKIILFSTFRNTTLYLVDRLLSDGITACLVWGNMNRPKQEVIDEFRENPKERVLVATEVAAEGVDLQFCRVLINYDLPWNPMRIEQRIGRIDRLGQSADLIHIWNLYFSDSIDDRIVSRLHNRLKIFEQALGEPEPVVGEVITQLESDLLTQRLTEEEENGLIEQAFMAIEQVRQQQEELEKTASQMIAHGGILLEKIGAAQELSRRITEEDLLIYVRDFLSSQAPGHSFEQNPNEPNKVDIKLPPALASEFNTFLHQKGMLGQTLLASGELRQCVFLNRIAGTPSKNIERIHQFHPLIHFVSTQLKEASTHFYPLVSIILEGHHLPPSYNHGHYVFCIKKWSFEGVKPEEILATSVCPWGEGTPLDTNESDRLINLARLYGQDWLDAPDILDASLVEKSLDLQEAYLDKRYSKTVAQKQLENSDRAHYQLYSLDKHFKRQHETLEKVLATHMQVERKVLVKATQGKIDALSRRVEIQRERIRQREKVVPTSHFVCAGVIWFRP